MSDQEKEISGVHEHLDKIKGHLDSLSEIVPPESLTRLTVKFNEQHEMMVCMPDPNNPGGVICR